jgi:hypothetical protein
VTPPRELSHPRSSLGSLFSSAGSFFAEYLSNRSAQRAISLAAAEPTSFRSLQINGAGPEPQWFYPSLVSRRRGGLAAPLGFGNLWVVA